MPGGRGRSRRRRVKTQKYDPIDNHEARMLAQALENSMVDVRRVEPVDIPEAAVFRPTLKDFSAGAIKYIERIRPVAEPFGIVKIIPPAGWNPPCCVDRTSKRKFRTRIQDIHGLQQGGGFDTTERSVTEYEALAQSFKAQWQQTRYAEDPAGPRDMTYETLEEDYWRTVETACEPVQVEYGNDLDTLKYSSGFPRPSAPLSGDDMTPDVDFSALSYYQRCSWNVNNFPRNTGSVLRHIRTDINGVNVPWLYFGMLFSSFCWHNEDNYMYSVNYQHLGAPKQWYGVPGHGAEAFELAMRKFLKERFDQEPDLLHHMTTQLSPSLLVASRVPVFKLRQNPGEFVITFPKAFHGGFSYGFNCGEAVNFATPGWIEYGREAMLRYRRFARPSVISHDRIILLLSYHLQDLDEVAARILLRELERLKREELYLRPRLYEGGVRDVSGQITLPPNRLDLLDSASADYDDKRMCHLCRHICFLSAVACNCSRSRVACLHHEHLLCDCPKSDKFMLCWASIDDMEQMIRRVETYVASLTTPRYCVPVAQPAIKPGHDDRRETGVAKPLKAEPIKPVGAVKKRSRGEYGSPRKTRAKTEPMAGPSANAAAEVFQGSMPEHQEAASPSSLVAAHASPGRLRAPSGSPRGMRKRAVAASVPALPAMPSGPLGDSAASTPVDPVDAPRSSLSQAPDTSASLKAQAPATHDEAAVLSRPPSRTSATTTEEANPESVPALPTTHSSVSAPQIAETIPARDTAWAAHEAHSGIGDAKTFGGPLEGQERSWEEGSAVGPLATAAPSSGVAVSQ